MMNQAFAVGDVVSVLRACRLPAVEEVIATGTIERVSETDGGESLYWVGGLACARTARVLRKTEMRFAPYRLPDGRIVMVDASAAKDARVIDFTLADGSIVLAFQVPTAREDFARIRRTRACYRCGASPEHCDCPDEYEPDGAR